MEKGDTDSSLILGCSNGYYLYPPFEGKMVSLEVPITNGTTPQCIGGYTSTEVPIIVHHRAVLAEQLQGIMEMDFSANKIFCRLSQNIKIS